MHLEGEPVQPSTLAERYPFLAAYPKAKFTFCDARCLKCGALYRAWIDKLAKPAPFHDLSFRESFCAEPSPRDLPSVAALRRIADDERRAQAQVLRKQMEDLHERVKQADDQIGKPSHWEVYLRTL